MYIYFYLWTVIFCLLKLAKHLQSKLKSVLFLLDNAYKAFVTIQVNVSILRAIYKLHIPFLQGENFHTQGENYNKLKLFPWGRWEEIVSAAPTQANNIIKYCTKIIIRVEPP